MVIKLAIGFVKALPKIISVAGKLVNAVLKVVVGLPALLLAKGLAAAGQFGLGLLKGFNAAIGKVKAVIERILAPIKGVVEKVKNIFPIKLGSIFSGLKLPHFTVSGGKFPFGVAGKGKVPSWDVKWYAQGGLMKEPTLFGGGEKGDEAILPLDPFWKKLDKIASSSGDITINVYGAEAQSPKEIASEVKRMLIRETKQRRLAW